MSLIIVSFQSNVYQLQARDIDFGINVSSVPGSGLGTDEDAWLKQARRTSNAVDDNPWLEHMILMNTFGSSPYFVRERTIGFFVGVAFLAILHAADWLAPGSGDDLAPILIPLMAVTALILGKVFGEK